MPNRPSLKWTPINGICRLNGSAQVATFTAQFCMIDAKILLDMAIVFGFQVGFWNFFICFPGIVNIPVRTWVYQDFQMPKFEQLGAFRNEVSKTPSVDPIPGCIATATTMAWAFPGAFLPFSWLVETMKIWVVYIFASRTGREKPDQAGASFCFLIT